MGCIISKKSKKSKKNTDNTESLLYNQNSFLKLSDENISLQNIIQQLKYDIEQLEDDLRVSQEDYDELISINIELQENNNKQMNQKIEMENAYNQLKNEYIRLLTVVQTKY